MLPFPLKTKEIPRLSIKDDQVDRLIKQEVGLGVLLCEVTSILYFIFIYLYHTTYRIYNINSSNNLTVIAFLLFDMFISI